MKIYFAGSIRGGRDDQALYYAIIKELKTYGTVLTEHIGEADVEEKEVQVQKSDIDIYTEDMSWLRESDVIVAEVTVPSIGVGYEIGQAHALGKSVLCLFRENASKRISAMVSGNKDVTIITYTDTNDLFAQLKEKLHNI